ncbi:MAG: Lrp/AsnC family transcriptional regulator [Desulfonauticus sp.]|nr:Lrp/AsnC family transcriptional regulator [Desulfonauticus sp.]
MRYSIPFTRQELLVLKVVQGDLPESPTPFRDIAKSVGISEEAVLQLLIRLKEQGYIRRFGATLRHQQAGYNQNAMVAWRVPEDKVEQVANIFVSRPEITHCYERKIIPDWPYNIYTMIHAATKEDCEQLIEYLSKQTGISDYEILESVQELKKTSMEYF